MNSSPITAWEGAGAYFTFADKPFILAIILAGAVASCLYTIVAMVRHENESTRKLEKR
jgi:hypothetical protein